MQTNQALFIPCICYFHCINKLIQIYVQKISTIVYQEFWFCTLNTYIHTYTSHIDSHNNSPYFTILYVNFFSRTDTSWLPRNCTANVSPSRAFRIFREYLSCPASNKIAPKGFSKTGENTAKHLFSWKVEKWIQFLVPIADTFLP